MLQTYAIWSEITEPGDAIAGLLRRELGVSNSLELISDGIGSKELASLLPADYFQAPEFIQTLTDSLECWRRRIAIANPEKSLERIAQLGGELITPESVHWPKALEDLADHLPAALWVLGNPKVFEETAISVIGARLASDYGLSLTQDLARFCVNQGWLIVSGGAQGIDAKASKTALENRGNTICVMAGGLDRLYPSANLELFSLVRQAGAVISELPPGVSPSRWRFLQRNRLIACLGKATVVVEAGYRSGSINTAYHANEIGRPVGAIPGPVNSVRSAGCHRLIREQRAELIATPGQLAELMGLEAESDSQELTRSDNQTRVLDALHGQSLSPEVIARIAGMTLDQTNYTLAQLSQRQLVREISIGWQKL